MLVWSWVLFFLFIVSEKSISFIILSMSCQDLAIFGSIPQDKAFIYPFEAIQCILDYLIGNNKIAFICKWFSWILHLLFFLFHKKLMLVYIYTNVYQTFYWNLIFQELKFEIQTDILCINFFRFNGTINIIKSSWRQRCVTDREVWLGTTRLTLLPFP